MNTKNYMLSSFSFLFFPFHQFDLFSFQYDASLFLLQFFWHNSCSVSILQQSFKLYYRYTQSCFLFVSLNNFINLFFWTDSLWSSLLFWSNWVRHSSMYSTATLTNNVHFYLFYIFFFKTRRRQKECLMTG